MGTCVSELETISSSSLVAKFAMGNVPVTLVVKSMVPFATIEFVIPEALTRIVSELISMLLSSTFTDKVDVAPRLIESLVDANPFPGTTVIALLDNLSLAIEPAS